jgi:hypothetical protein
LIVSYSFFKINLNDYQNQNNLSKEYETINFIISLNSMRDYSSKRYKN